MEHTKAMICECHFEEHASPNWESPGFVFCRLHSAAPALLAALERIDSSSDGATELAEAGKAAWHLDLIQQIARDAIKQAKGDTNETAALYTNLDGEEAND